MASLASTVYVSINVVMSGIALYLILLFEWRFGLDADASREQLRAVQVMAAGFGAMALFRSSLLNVRMGETDVSIGPNGMLQILLSVADRAVDRGRGKARSELVAKMMSDVSFAKAHAALPAFCIALMQNLPPQDVDSIGSDVLKLRSDKNLADEVKVLNLGLLLTRYFGEKVAKAAVEQLGSAIKEPK